MPDNVRKFLTEFDFSIGSGKDVLDNIMKIFDQLQGYVNTNLLSRALGAADAETRLVAINQLMDDTKKKFAESTKGSTDSKDAIQKAKLETEEFRNSILGLANAAAKGLSPKPYDDAVRSIRTLSFDLKTLATTLRMPLSSGSESFQKLQEYATRLSNVLGSMSNMPLMSPASVQVMQQVSIAAKDLLNTLSQISSGTSAISSKNLFRPNKDLFLTGIDTQNADALLKKTESMSIWWEKNKARVAETYELALSGETNAIKKTVERSRLWNGVADAAKRFYDAARRGELPEQYIDKMRQVLNTLESGDTVLGNMRQAAQRLVNDLASGRIDSVFKGPLADAERLVAELSSTRLSANAENYGMLIKNAIAQGQIAYLASDAAGKKYWDSQRALLEQWGTEYQSTLNRIKASKEALMIGSPDQKKVDKTVSTAEFKASQEYVTKLIERRNALNEVVQSTQNYINTLSRKIKLSDDEKKSLADSNSLLQQAKAILGQYNNEITKAGDNAKRSFASIQQASQSSKKVFQGLNSEVKDFGYFMEIAIEKIIRYRVAFTVMQEIVRWFKSTLTIPKELEHMFANLRKVMDESTTNFKEIRTEAIGFAIDFGVAIKDVIDIMYIWAQQGKNQADIISLTRTTLVGMSAADLTASQAVEALTSAINQFNISAEDSYIIMDKLLNVQKSFAVSAQDLADSIKLLGSTTELLGSDINELFGNITAVVEITRKSGKEAANSLKTIFSRVVKTDAIESLQKLGIAVYDMNGDMRPLGILLDDIAQNWNTLTRAEQVHLAHVIGGIRRYNDFIVLMENYGTSLKAAAISMQSTGEAFAAAEIEVSTLYRAIEGAQAGFTKFTDAVGTSALGFAKLGYAYKALSSALVADTGQLTGFGKVASNTISIIATLATTLFAVKAVSFTWEFGMKRLTKAVYENAAANAYLNVATGNLSKEEARARISADLNAIGHARLMAEYEKTGIVALKTAGDTIVLAKTEKLAAAATAESAVVQNAFTVAALNTGRATQGLIGKMAALKIAAIGVGKAFGWTGLIFTGISLVLTGAMIAWGKNKQKLEDVADTSNITAIELSKLSKLQAKSIKTTEQHTKALIDTAVAYRKFGDETGNVLESFAKRLGDVNQFLAIFNQEAIPEVIWSDNAEENAQKMISTIGKTVASLKEMRNIQVESRRIANENLVQQIELEKARHTELEKFSASVAKVQNRLYGVSDSIDALITSINETDGINLRSKVAEEIDAILIKIEKAPFDEAMFEPFKRLVAGTKMESLVGPFYKALEDYSIAKSSFIGLQAGSKYGEEFAKKIDFTKLSTAGLERAFSAVVDSTRNATEELAKMTSGPSLAQIYEFQTALTAATIDSAMALDNNTASLSDSTRALQLRSGALSSALQVGSAVSQLDSDMTTTINSLEAALVETARSVGVLVFTEEEYKQNVEESITAMSKAKTILASYGANIKGTAEIRNKAIEIDIRAASVLGELTSAYELHTRGLAKGLQAAYDAYRLQFDALTALTAKESESADITKARESINQQLIKGLQEQIFTWKETQRQIGETGDIFGSFSDELADKLEIANTMLTKLMAEASGAKVDWFKDGIETVKELTAFYKTLGTYSDEEIANEIARLQNISEEDRSLNFRIGILKKMVSERWEELKIMERAYILEKDRVETLERSYRTIWNNLKRQNELQTEYYKGLQGISSKLSDYFSEQKRSLDDTVSTLTVEAALFKELETSIARSEAASEGLDKGLLKTSVSVNMSRDAMEALLHELGIEQSFIDENLDILMKIVTNAQEELALTKQITAQKKLQSDIDKNINSAFDIRSNVSKKYFTLMEDFQKSAGATDKELHAIRIAAAKDEIRLMKERALNAAIIMAEQEGNLTEVNKLQKAGADAVVDNEIAAKEWALRLLEVEGNLIDVKRTLEESAQVSEDLAGLMSTVLVGATLKVVKNFEDAYKLEEDMATQQAEIAELQRDLANATDPAEQERITFSLQEAKKEYQEMNDEANKLQSVMGNLATIGKELALGLSGIIIDINQEQLKESLSEIITRSTFGGKVASILSGGIIQASDSGSMDYYYRMLAAVREGADIFYLQIIRAFEIAATKMAGIMAAKTPSTSVTGENTDVVAAGNSVTEDLSVTTRGLIVVNERLDATLNKLILAIQTGQTGATPGAVGAGIAPPGVPHGPENGPEEISRKTPTEIAIKALTAQLGMMIGTYAGKGTAGASFGSTIGATIGGTLKKSAGLWGALGFGILGGFLGGLIDKREEPEVPPIGPDTSTEDNTEALEATTVSLNKLSVAMNDIRQEMINAPSRFTTPPQTYGGMMTGGGGGFSVLIQVNGSLDAATGRQITNDINSIYRNQYRRQGYSSRLT